MMAPTTKNDFIIRWGRNNDSFELELDEVLREERERISQNIDHMWNNEFPSIEDVQDVIRRG